MERGQVGSNGINRRNGELGTVTNRDLCCARLSGDYVEVLIQTVFF